MEAENPSPLYSNFYRTLKRRAENGHQFTLAEIEDEVDRDPPSRRVFEQLAADVRAGRDVTVGELASRLRVPAPFAVMLVEAFVMGEVALIGAHKPEAVN